MTTPRKFTYPLWNVRLTDYAVERTTLGREAKERRFDMAGRGLLVTAPNEVSAKSIAADVDREDRLGVSRGVQRVPHGDLIVNMAEPRW